MMIISLLSLSAELTLGLGQAAPNERATSQTPYGYVDWGYHIWTNFFAQATYVKGAPFGAEPYIRIGFMDHPLYEETVYFNNMRIGARLNESITSYEMGFSKPVSVPPHLRLYWGAAFAGNFCRWERTSYGATDARIIDQVCPGIVGFARTEWWWKYKLSLEEEANVNLILGLSPRLSYMGFRPSVWPCPDWFVIIEGYVGVRW
ncbi:MAG: hypothetical protein ABIM46_01025 [candidate division WOR-3 bacterium]